MVNSCPSALSRGELLYTLVRISACVCSHCLQWWELLLLVQSAFTTDEDNIVPAILQCSFDEPPTSFGPDHTPSSAHTNPPCTEITFPLQKSVCVCRGGGKECWGVHIHGTVPRPRKWSAWAENRPVLSAGRTKGENSFPQLPCTDLLGKVMDYITCFVKPLSPFRWGS